MTQSSVDGITIFALLGRFLLEFGFFKNLYLRVCRVVVNGKKSFFLFLKIREANRTLIYLFTPQMLALAAADQVSQLGDEIIAIAPSPLSPLQNPGAEARNTDTLIWDIVS